MSKPVIHFLETVDAAAMQLIPTEAFRVGLPSRDMDDTRVRALIVRGGVSVDRALIDRCPELRVVARCGVGVNNIDVDYCTERGIQVLNVPGVNAATVAEHTIGLTLMLVRGMYRLVREVKRGNWSYRDEYAGHELRQLKLGIIGMGDIGKRVGAVAGAMGMRVSSAGRDRAERERVLRQSDVISLHVPLTEQTRGLIDAAALETIQPGAYLINTARGEVVEAEALLVALGSGQLGGYASDLLPTGDGETVKKIIDHERVLITPHAASLTALTYREMSVMTVKNVVAYLSEGKVSESNMYNNIFYGNY